jgi:hypothetical protein
MADLSMNVNYAKPQTTSLGEMVNLAGGIQNFQQAQQLNPLELEKKQIENQVLRQTNDERLKMQQFIQNPENWQTDGKIDLTKINKLADIAPLTGPAKIKDFTGLHTDQSTAAKARQDLNKDQKAQVSNIKSALGFANVQDPKQVIKAYQGYIQRSPDDPEIHRLLNAEIKILERAQAGPHITQDLLTEAGMALPQETQRTTFAQKPGLASIGGATAETVTTPQGIGGQAPSTKFTGNVQPNVLGPSIVEINGIKYYAQPSKVQGGQPTLTPVGAEGVTLPQQGNAPQAPQVNAPQVAAPQANAPQQRKPIVVEDMPVPQGGIPQLNTFQQARLESGNLLIKNSVEAANAAREGEETSRQVKNYMSAASGSAPGQFLRKAGQWVAGDPQLEILSKNLADQQLRNMQIMGARTDAASSDVKAASGKADLTREGLQAIVDRTDASNTAVTAFQKGLKRYTDQGLNGIVHADKFKEAWADNYDVRVFKAMNILNSNMSQAQKQMEQQKLLKGLTNAQLKDLQEKASNIERLQNGGR